MCLCAPLLYLVTTEARRLLPGTGAVVRTELGSSSASAGSVPNHQAISLVSCGFVVVLLFKEGFILTCEVSELYFLKKSTCYVLSTQTVPWESSLATVQGQRTTLELLLSTFMWVVGIKLNFHSKRLYRLSHLSGVHVLFFERGSRVAQSGLRLII